MRLKSTFIINSILVVFVFSGCKKCENQKATEPKIIFEKNVNADIKIYNIDSYKEYVGSLNSDTLDILYGINIKKDSMKYIIEYSQGINDTFTLFYNKNIEYTDNCNYNVKVTDKSHRLTRNNEIQYAVIQDIIEKSEIEGIKIIFN